MREGERGPVFRLGLALGNGTFEAVVVDMAGTVVASGVGDPGDSTRVLGETLAPLDHTRIRLAMIASAEFRSLLDRRAGFARVGVLRVGAPATTAVPPLAGWPADLASLVTGPCAIVGGGTDFDGTELAPLDVDAVRSFARDCDGTVDAVAVSSVFSPLRATVEEDAARVVGELLGSSVPITLSHRIGEFGLLERENAAILNAGLVREGSALVDRYTTWLRSSGLDPEVFIAQNDGTVASATYAAAMPLRAVDGGLVSAVRGLAHLSELDELVVSALGAATAPVSAGTWEFVDDLARRATVLGAARQRVVDAAILRGADPATVVVETVDETPLTYMSSGAARIRLRASGVPFDPAH